MDKRINDCNIEQRYTNLPAKHLKQKIERYRSKSFFYKFHFNISFNNLKNISSVDL